MFANDVQGRLYSVSVYIIDTYSKNQNSKSYLWFVDYYIADWPFALGDRYSIYILCKE